MWLTITGGDGTGSDKMKRGPRAATGIASAAHGVSGYGVRGAGCRTMRIGSSRDRDSAPNADTVICPHERTTKGLTMTATAQEIADTLNRAFDEPSMTMPILLADVIP